MGHNILFYRPIYLTKKLINSTLYLTLTFKAVVVYHLTTEKDRKTFVHIHSRFYSELVPANNNMNNDVEQDSP